MEQRFPMEQGVLRCRQVGDRAELTMEIPGPGQGLYRGYVLGEGGQMDLGTLLPEGGGRRLHRTVPVAELRKRGCWPVTGGRAVLTYAFSGGSTQSGPRGWTGLDRPESCFPADPILAQGAREGGRAFFFRRGDGVFCLAWPWELRRPFPLVPAFCLAQVKNLGGRRYVVYHFTPEGRPFVEGTAAEG